MDTTTIGTVGDRIAAVPGPDARYGSSRVGLIKKRPKIGLLAPRQVAVGRPFPVTVVLDCAADVPVESVEVVLVGEIVHYSQGQYGQHSHATQFCRAVSRPITDRVDLREGEHRFEATFALQDHQPGSITGQGLRIVYAVDVHVDIPWWPDARARFLLPVVAPQRELAPEGARHVFVSDLDGPQANRPYVEVSLGTTRVEPGVVLRGAVALSNVEQKDYRAIRLSLVRAETLKYPLGTHTAHVPVGRWTVPFEQLRESEPVHFTVRMPFGLMPGFELMGFAIQWLLQVQVDVAWSRDPNIWVPIEVLAPGLVDDSMRLAPLAVGSDRIELIWQDVAARTGYAFFDGALRLAEGETHVEIRREHRGRDGLLTVADVTFPDLGIDLRVESRGRNRELEGRDPAQVAWLLEQLGDAVSAAPPNTANDRLLGWEVDDAGQRAGRLSALAERMATVARALEPARARVPAPVALAEHVADWERAAARLGGILHRGPMRVVATRDEVELELRTEWTATGAPARTVAQARPPMPIDARHHVDWSARDGNELRTELDLGALMTEVEAVFIDAETIQLVMPAPHPDLDAAVGKLEGLVALGRRLSGKLGGYR